MLGEMPAASVVAAGVCQRSGQASPGAEAPGRGEEGDVPDLGHDGGGGEQADARDQQQTQHSGVTAESLLQHLVGHLDLVRQAIDQPQVDLEPVLRNLWQPELCHDSATLPAKTSVSSGLTP